MKNIRKGKAMSDWNRSGREDDQARYRFEDRDRHGYGGQDRWRREPQRFGEQRSFQDDQRNPVADQQRDFPERMRDEEGRERGRREWGFGEGYRERYGQRGDKDYRGEVYRAQDYERDRQGYGQRQMGEEGRYGGRTGERYEGERYGGERQGAMSHNPTVERVAWGEADRGWRDERQGECRHRGRGPKNYVRSDDRIREDINDRLSDDAWLDASEIEVKVANCEVTLTGTVETREDKRRAEDLAEQVSGVKHVQNILRSHAGQAGTGAAQAGASAAAAGTNKPTVG